MVLSASMIGLTSLGVPSCLDLWGPTDSLIQYSRARLGGGLTTIEQVVSAAVAWPDLCNANIHIGLTSC